MNLSDETVQFARIALQAHLDKLDHEISERRKDIETLSVRVIDARKEAMELEDRRKLFGVALLEIIGQPVEIGT